MAPKAKSSSNHGKDEVNEKGTVDKLPPLDVDPAYNWAADKFRQLTSTSLMCAFGCGGSKCKWCHPVGRFQEKDYVIKGLFSNWVPPHFVAVSRPTTETVRDFDIPQQFLDLGIKGIVNLQTPGEHGQCYTLEASGFSYNPEDFMAKGIFFYNYAWPDFGVPNINELLDVVQVVDFSVGLGKVAIHCHAGKGRTCALIACYLVYVHRVPASAAICYVRQYRAGSIQTRGQVMLIRNFEAFLQPHWILFPRVELNCKARSLETVLSMQKKIFHGYERKRLKNIPKFVYISCKLLLYLAGALDTSCWDSMGGIGAGASFPMELAQIVQLYFGNRSGRKTSVETEGGNSTEIQSGAISPFSGKRTKSSENFLNLANRSNSDSADGNFSIPTIVEPVSARSLKKSSDIRLARYDMRLDDERDVGPSSIYPLDSIMDVSADRRMKSLRHQSFDFVTSDSSSCRLSSPVANSEDADQIDFKASEGGTSPIDESKKMRDVVNSLFCEYEEVAAKVRNLEEEMNLAPRCWDLLKKVEDPKIVAVTLWDWFDQLEFPILTSSNLEDLLTTNRRQVLSSIEDEKTLVKFLCQCITQQAAETFATVLSFVAKLLFDSPEKLENVIDLVLTHFTQVGINCVRPGSGNRSKSSKSLKKKKKDLWDKSVQLLCNLVVRIRGKEEVGDRSEAQIDSNIADLADLTEDQSSVLLTR